MLEHYFIVSLKLPYKHVMWHAVFAISQQKQLDLFRSQLTWTQ